MSGTTVWTASVWGGAKSSALPPGGKLKEGEEECMICRGDVPASVGFRPCGHTVCFSCVENMRAKNIFKADKGVRCPFCRTFIEHYETLKSSNSARAQELLQEANRAAAFAAAARSPAPSPQSPVVTLPHVREPENWICPACNNINLHWRTECNRCHKPDPRSPRPVVRAKDVLKCSDEEIITYVNEKLHPHLNKAFLEAGTPYCQGRVTGTQEQIISALKNRGEERLLRVVKGLVDSGKLHQCVAHFFGNYTIQDLLEATAKLRTATEASYQFMWDSFRAANRGLDPFGLLHHGMLPVSVECANHPQGTYVVQKVVELGTCWEVLQMTQRLVSMGPALTADPRGIHVVAKCLQQLVALSTGELNPDVANVADTLCLGFWKMPDKMKYAAHHGLGAKILADAIQLGLPKFGALKLATRICSRAQDYASSNSGLAIIIALLNVQPMAPGSAELVRDLVCLIAWSLQGHLKDYVMMQEDPRGPFLVEYCIKRLAEEQEIAWIDAVIQELVGSGDILAGSETALEVLKMALSLSVYDTESVDMHLQQLEELVGPELGPAIEMDVYARISNNGPPPAPKYFMPSYIQPDLKYHVLNGVRLPPTPKPPGKGKAARKRDGHASNAASHNEQPYGAANGEANGSNTGQHMDHLWQGGHGDHTSPHTQYNYQVPTPTPSYDVTAYDAPSYDAPSYDASSYQPPSLDTPFYDAPPHNAPLYDTPVAPGLLADGYGVEPHSHVPPAPFHDAAQYSPEPVASVTDFLVPQFGQLIHKDTTEPPKEPFSGSSTPSSNSSTVPYRPPATYPTPHAMHPHAQPPIPQPLLPALDSPCNAPPPYPLRSPSNSQAPLYFPLQLGPKPIPPSRSMPPQFNPMPYTPPMYAPPPPYMPMGTRPMHHPPPPRPVPIQLPVPAAPSPADSPTASALKESSVVMHIVTPSKSQRSVAPVVPKPIPAPAALTAATAAASVVATSMAAASAAPIVVAPSPAKRDPARAPAPPTPQLLATLASVPKPPAAAAPARQQSNCGALSWQCKVCTYEHVDSEAVFLVCAVCGTEKGAGTYGAGR